MALIEKTGLDRAKALEVLTNGAPGSPLVKMVSARMVSRDYAPNFLLRLMTKDLGYALGEANQHAVPLATVAAALKIFEKAVADGRGDLDFSALVEQFRQSSG
jgi:3-hydroxyisobutyrate dehydrogenase